MMFPLLMICALAFACLGVEKGPLPLVAEVHASSVVYHGNRNSHVFHQPGCRYFNCKNCVVVFSSLKQAIEAGFRPCKICKP
ncbi:Ada metal-binding domain-containing protein [uncultured Pseudodesulfovibrio sp.]|uniref:Ada metal-binding domain-containing protein n=1 Tax=uncultured Pseudodesulfovibrio sp. TaxID=2035858 RepID=UPI00374A5C4A